MVKQHHHHHHHHRWPSNDGEIEKKQEWEEGTRKDSNIPWHAEYIILRGAIIASCARSDANNPYTIHHTE